MIVEPCLAGTTESLLPGGADRDAAAVVFVGRGDITHAGVEPDLVVEPASVIELSGERGGIGQPGQRDSRS